jgi:hemerythrin
MELLEVKSELSVGVRILDCDHREMAEAISDINTAVLADQERSRTGQLLRRLARFTLTHFQLEEEMMAATKYPGMAVHRINHHCLMGQLGALISRYGRGGFALNAHSLNFLSHWHTTHIEKEDLHYGLWLSQDTRRAPGKISSR